VTLALLWLLVVVLLLILAVVTWTVLAWPAPRPASDPLIATQPVSLLIPARNEADNIADCLRSAAKQPEIVGEIIVLDDRSTDDTAAIVRRQARADPRIRLLDGAELPAGWTGKCWACQQLAGAAEGPWLLFLDADARLAPGAVVTMLQTAGRYGCTLISCWPGLVMRSGWEQLLMPLLNFLTFTLYPAPLAYLQTANPALALAHGACIMLSKTDYIATGGHRAVRSELFEDTSLARHWRRWGLASCCVDGSQLVTVRMYDSLRGIWLGFEKNFYNAFSSPQAFFAFLLLHLALFLLPFALLAFALVSRAAPVVLTPVVLACAMVLLVRVLLSVRFRHPLWSVLLHPLAELFLLAIALNSWWRTASGHGVRWKGRIYRAASANQSRRIEQ
jgi:chlorobactene glucosyltransferase